MINTENTIDHSQQKQVDALKTIASIPETKLLLDKLGSQKDERQNRSDGPFGSICSTAENRSHSENLRSQTSEQQTPDSEFKIITSIVENRLHLDTPTTSQIDGERSRNGGLKANCPSVTENTSNIEIVNIETEAACSSFMENAAKIKSFYLMRTLTRNICYRMRQDPPSVVPSVCVTSDGQVNIYLHKDMLMEISVDGSLSCISVRNHSLILVGNKDDNILVSNKMTNVGGHKSLMMIECADRKKIVLDKVNKNISLGEFAAFNVTDRGSVIRVKEPTMYFDSLLRDISRGKRIGTEHVAPLRKLVRTTRFSTTDDGLLRVQIGALDVMQDVATGRVNATLQNRVKISMSPCPSSYVRVKSYQVFLHIDPATERIQARTNYGKALVKRNFIALRLERLLAFLDMTSRMVKITFTSTRAIKNDDDAETSENVGNTSSLPLKFSSTLSKLDECSKEIIGPEWLLQKAKDNDTVFSPVNTKSKYICEESQVYTTDRPLRTLDTDNRYVFTVDNQYKRAGTQSIPSSKDSYKDSSLNRDVHNSKDNQLDAGKAGSSSKKAQSAIVSNVDCVNESTPRYIQTTAVTLPRIRPHQCKMFNPISPANDCDIPVDYFPPTSNVETRSSSSCRRYQEPHITSYCTGLDHVSMLETPKKMPYVKMKDGETSKEMTTLHDTNYSRFGTVPVKSKPLTRVAISLCTDQQSHGDMKQNQRSLCRQDSLDRRVVTFRDFEDGLKRNVPAEPAHRSPSLSRSSSLSSSSETNAAYSNCGDDSSNDSTDNNTQRLAVLSQYTNDGDGHPQEFNLPIGAVPYKRQCISACELKSDVWSHGSDTCRGKTMHNIKEDTEIQYDVAVTGEAADDDDDDDEADRDNRNDRKQALTKKFLEPSCQDTPFKLSKCKSDQRAQQVDRSLFHDGNVRKIIEMFERKARFS